MLLSPFEVIHERPPDLPAVSRNLLELQTRAQVRRQACRTASAGPDDRWLPCFRRSWNKRLIDANVERLRDRDLAWADVALVSAMHIQKDALFAILERCRAIGLRTVVGGPIASSLSTDEINADHVVIGEAESLIATLARDLERGTRQTRVPGRRTAGDGDEPPPRPQPDQDEPLLHDDRAVLARMPLQLRVLRHHRDLRSPSAHQGCAAGARRTRPVARRRLARELFSSSTTTSSATRRAPKNCAPRWPNGAVNTRPASTSIPKLR